MDDFKIGLITRNRAGALENTLLDLREEGLLSKVFVVDGSDDRDSKSVCDDLDVGYHRQQSTGMTAARNEALEHCDSEYIVFIDDDVRVSDGWYEAVCEAFEDEKVVGVTGKLEGEELELGGFARKVRDFLFGGRESFGEISDNGVINGDFFYDKRKEVDHMPGCNMAYHVPTLEKIGGFQEEYDVG
ncbi:MAG: glycosyltransferase, partial [Candidatus Nanohaloarchaea archaeon]